MMVDFLVSVFRYLRPEVFSGVGANLCLLCFELNRPGKNLE